MIPSSFQLQPAPPRRPRVWRSKWRKGVGAALALAVVLGGLVSIATTDTAHAAAPDSINTVEGGGGNSSFGIPATASSYTPTSVAVDSAGDSFMAIDDDSTFYVA